MQYAMGYANIPPDPTSNGVCRVEIEMDEEEMQSTVSHLKLMVEKLIADGEDQSITNGLSGLELRSTNGIASENMSSMQSDLSSFFPLVTDTPTHPAYNPHGLNLPSQPASYLPHHAPIPTPVTSVPGQLFSQPAFSLAETPAFSEPESFGLGANFVSKLGHTVQEGVSDRQQQISALDPEVPDFRVPNPGLSIRPAPLVTSSDPPIAPPHRHFKEPLPSPGSSVGIELHTPLSAVHTPLSASHSPAAAQPAAVPRPWGQSYAQVGAPQAPTVKPTPAINVPTRPAGRAAAPSPPPRNQSPVPPAYSAGPTYAQRTLPDYGHSFAQNQPVAALQPPPPPPPRAPQFNIIQPPPPPPPRRTAAAVAAQGISQAPASRPPVARPQEHARAPGWTLCYTTDGEDHNKDPVQSMVYCASFEGLPGGDGHGGWLISASRHLLNLWECSAGGGSKGQPSLQVMHSQMTDFLSSCLTIEPSTQLLFAASVDTAKGSECVSVHSLSAEAGFLAYKYRFALGDEKSGRAKTGPQLQQVVALHPLGSQLRNCCAASCGSKIYILDASGTGTSGPTQRPKLEWKAHDNTITALHCSNFSQALLSGTADGTIHMWSMKEPRPVQPVKRLNHAAAVSGICCVNDHLLATGAHDGKVLLWDLRMGASPMQTANPDGTAVVKLAVSPVADCLAVATTKGLYCVDLIDYSGVVSAVTDKPLVKPYNSIEWNTSTGELYACGVGGVISVFKQRY